MPFIYRGRVIDASQPVSKMSGAELRDFQMFLTDYVGKTDAPVMAKKLKDVEQEIEWRRVANSKKQA